MATRFEKLDKQLDRLGGFFSRKKRTAESQDSAVASNQPATPIPALTELDAPSQTFPQPSFIRPTSSRMVAREEVLLTPHSARRAKSLPESTSTPPALTMPASLTDNEAPDDCPPIPARYSSIGPGIPQRSSSVYPDSSRDGPPSALLEFSFSAASRESEDISLLRRRSRASSKSLTRSTSVSISPKAPVNRRRYSAGAQHRSSIPLRQEIDLHRDSAQQNKYSSLVPVQGESQRLEASSRECLTPTLSPRLVPLSEVNPDKLDVDNNKATHRPASQSVSGTGIRHIGEAPSKSARPPKRTTVKVPSLNPILKEPSVTDFLALSDDDIADGHTAHRTRVPSSNPPTFALPPDPSPASTPLRTKPAYPMLTLSPPLASRPATAAAFEAARIAAKYQFDLVYIVNLWPSHMSRLSRSSPLSQFCGTPVATSPARVATPSPPQSPVSNRSGYDSGFESRSPAPRDRSRGGLTGRLLAAYGLPSIMYPFRISAPVHQKVLRNQGWLEYRNESGAQDEFARGYSCSFYTGHSPAREREADSETSPRGGKQRNPKNKPVNRGIVFAAFRLPLEDGTPVCSDSEELEELHHDAEALVDMLIDIHMTQRQTRAPLGTSRRCAAGSNERLVQPAAPLVTT